MGVKFNVIQRANLQKPTESKKNYAVIKSDGE